MGELRLFGTVPAPLNISRTNNGVVVSWPDTGAYLENNPNVVDVLWSPVTNSPLLNSGTNSVTLPAIPGKILPPALAVGNRLG